MPQVFSPGEPETRPLDPTAAVYTTAQKVADLLDIGPQDAVLVSGDSVANGVFVTGTDFRNIGFSVDDTILIYSDGDPLGVERTISSIATDTLGVKLGFTSTITHADFQVIDNAYIQNLASFTNGRTRGLTKTKVESIILRMQDQIDNHTHNAWRPYLASAEYINFDTYKPYRRRYYTDYVGTSPLLYRNVQQILRLELWQGDDYREIGTAEARLRLPDDVRALTGSIVVSPGNGSAGLLTIGSGTANWRADFDKVTSAQNLADLINKEDRVGKTAVDFSPAFTLEGSTSNVAMHNEFLASSNADYGTGIVKITSMRESKGGETCSIVTTDSNIEISQTSSSSTTFTSRGATTINVASTSTFADAGVVVDSNGYVFRYTGKTATSFTGSVIVLSANTTLSDISGTLTQHQLSIDLHGGSASGDRGRLRDWWLDHEMGIIYFNNSYPFFEWNAIKTTYIYGERYVDKGVEDICTKMVAIDILMSDDRSVLIPEGTQNVDLTSKIQLYRADIDRTYPRYVEVVAFE